MTDLERAAAGARRLSAEMINEATERGDLDHETVQWAVIKILSWANDMNREAAPRTEFIPPVRAQWERA